MSINNKAKQIKCKNESIELNVQNSFSIYNITQPDVALFLNKILDIIEKAYSKIGGYKGVSEPKRFLKGISLLRIITDKDYDADDLINHQDNIMAVEVFRNANNSFKSIAFAKNIEISGSGVYAHELIKYDISNYKGFYWAEVSGAVEHLMKKFEGFPIPNIYAEEILNKRDLELDDDGIHYYRTIGLEDKTKYCKAIYGFKNIELYNKIVGSIIDILGIPMSYSEFKNYANSQPDKLRNESFDSLHVARFLNKLFVENVNKDESSSLIDLAKEYIDCIASASYEDDISEYPKDIIDCLKFSVNYLKKSGNNDINSIQQGEDLLSFITPLELHRF